MDRLVTGARRPRADVQRVLEAFFSQKAERMKELGLANVFAEAGVRKFIEAAATRANAGATAASSIEFYAASVGGIIVATFAGIASDRRFCGMFHSMISGSSLITVRESFCWSTSCVCAASAGIRHSTSASAKLHTKKRSAARPSNCSTALCR